MPESTVRLILNSPRPALQKHGSMNQMESGWDQAVREMDVGSREQSKTFYLWNVVVDVLTCGL